MKQNKIIRVLITEKEEFRYKVLAKMLQPFSDISLVGFASEREEMFRLLQSAPVDVLLFDMTLFRNESTDLISLLNSGFPRLKVIVCTDNHLGYYFRETMSNCMVSAHARKSLDAPELVDLVSGVYNAPEEEEANSAG
jgi:DNA-binding NarL/FixJ family response regulator